MRRSERSDRPSVRQMATEILVRVDTTKSFADVLLDIALNKRSLSIKDQALLTEITYGTLRWRGRIDSYLQFVVKRSLQRTDPFIRNLLRMTIYQLAFLDKIPPYAAVNEAVSIAKSHVGNHMAGFVNGVLRNFLRSSQELATPPVEINSAAVLAAYWSHPRWLIEDWLKYLPGETPALLEANNRQAPLIIRANHRRTTRESLLQMLKTNGVDAAATEWSPKGLWVRGQYRVDQLPGFREGLFQVQGEASQLISLLLAPQAGETVLDACAAPGGKATHIAELMEDTGTIIAADISPEGIKKINENKTRLGHGSIDAVEADMTQAVGQIYERTYDRILLDAPCSGLGTLRSHPEIKWNRTRADLARLQKLQRKLLPQLASRLKREGVLVYSTCTLSRIENEDVVEDFLAHHTGFLLESAKDHLPGEAKGLIRGKYFMALPHRHNTDGFFAVRIRKVG